MFTHFIPVCNIIPISLSQSLKYTRSPGDSSESYLLLALIHHVSSVLAVTNTNDPLPTPQMSWRQSIMDLMQSVPTSCTGFLWPILPTDSFNRSHCKRNVTVVGWSVGNVFTIAMRAWINDLSELSRSERRTPDDLSSLVCPCAVLANRHHFETHIRSLVSYRPSHVLGFPIPSGGSWYPRLVSCLLQRQETMDNYTPTSPLDSRWPLQPDIKKHASSSQTFGKTAIVVLVIAVVAYMYLVC